MANEKHGAGLALTGENGCLIRMDGFGCVKQSRQICQEEMINQWICNGLKNRY